MSEPTTIALDDESSWPPSVLSLLDKTFRDLEAYEKTQARIDKICEKDVLARVSPPPNPYSKLRAEVLVELEVLLSRVLLVGYHCTRLCVDEIESVLSSGLRTLGKPLVTERIERRVARGEFERDFADKLLRHDVSEDSISRLGRRTGMIWFVFNRATLTGEHGLKYLLGCWGGEAIYWSHMNNPPIMMALRSIGTACIVEAAVRVPDINTWSVPQKLVVGYLQRRKVKTCEVPEMEGFVRVPVAADQIRRVIRREDAAFGSVTQCDVWDTAIT